MICGKNSRFGRIRGSAVGYVNVIGKRADHATERITKPYHIEKEGYFQPPK
jgi:hypothetical protein